MGKSLGDDRMERLPKEPGLMFALETPSEGVSQISGGRLFQK